MAIQRMSPITGGYPNRALKRFFKKLQDISLRADLLDYTFENSATLPHCQAVLLGEISRHPRTFYSVSRGIAETTLLISRDFEQQVENIFRDEKLISRLEQLSALSLMLPAENRILSGVYYLILRQLAWHGINVVEVVSTSNEFTIVVKESDTQEALAALMQLKRQT
jgi:aspartokinase